MANGDAYEGWAILELMGHRRLGGYIKQVEQYGTAMVRIDVPGTDGQDPATQFYSGSSLYCVTPTTEEVARGLAERIRPAPVNIWDLPERKSLPEPPICEECGALVEDCGCFE